VVNAPAAAFGWMAAAFAAALLLSALVTRLQTWWMRRHPVPDLDRVLPEALQHETLVIYFHSPHCAHCRALTPLIERLRASGHPILMVDVQQRPEVARALRVVDTPTLVRLRRARIEAVLLGAQAEAKIRRFVEKA